MREYVYEIGGHRYLVKIQKTDKATAVVEVNGSEYFVDIITSEVATTPLVEATPAAAQPQPVAPQAPVTAPARTGAAASGAVTAPMPGVILKIKVKVGQAIKPGDVLLVIEAMKMENEIKAHAGGTVKEIMVSEGKSVQTGDPLLVIS